MKKIAVALAAFLASSSAWAGVGVTADLGGLSDFTTWAPSIDIRSSGWLVQIHGLDLIGNIDSKKIYTGVDVTKVTKKEKIAEDIEGVCMWGGGLKILTNTDFDPLDWNLVAEMRMGAERKKAAGIGIYVVPKLGITSTPLTADNDMGLVYGGGVQISTWMK